MALKDIKLVIVGDGGHAKVVRETAYACGIEELVTCDERESGSLEKAALHGTHVHVAIGDNAARAGAYERAKKLGLKPLSLIHPSSIVSPTVSVDEGVYIGINVIINPDSFISRYAIVNTGAIIEHDCAVGPSAFVGPGAVMCGGCSLGARSMLGAHATMIPKTHLGVDITVGAGATVTKDFREPGCVVGTPAHLLPPKPRTPRENF